MRLSIVMIAILVFLGTGCSKNDETVGMVPNPSQEQPGENPEEDKKSPKITEVFPLSGGMGTSVTIRGENLSTATEIYFNGTRAQVVQLGADNEIVAEIPFRAFSGPIRIGFDGSELIGPIFTYESSNLVGTLAGSTRGDVDGIGDKAKFKHLKGIVIKADGNLVVIDGHKIRSITPEGRVQTVAGGPPDLVDGSLEQARFNSPTGMTQDGNGHIFLADTFNHKIRRIYPTGTVVTWAGSRKGNADGMAMAEFNEPWSITIDEENHLYVTGSQNHRIRKISPFGVVSTIAGSEFGYKDGTGEEAQFKYPAGMAADRNLNIYVADAGNNRIRKVTPQGEVSTLAGGDSGYKDGLVSEAQFAFPRGLLLDKQGNIYVADTENHRIRKISPDGVVSTIAGGDRGHRDGLGAEAQFDQPRSLALDEENHILYVTDYYNNRVRKIFLD